MEMFCVSIWMLNGMTKAEKYKFLLRDVCIITI